MKNVKKKERKKIVLISCLFFPHIKQRGEKKRCTAHVLHHLRLLEQLELSEV